MNWKKDFDEAGQYASAFEGMMKRQKIDNETLYHILCISVEKYTAALAGMLNYIPMHSGLTYVIRELGKKTELPSGFYNEAKFLNQFMTYCSLDFENPKPISENDLQRMNYFLTDLRSFTALKVAEMTSGVN